MATPGVAPTTATATAATATTTLGPAAPVITPAGVAIATRHAPGGVRVCVVVCVVVAVAVWRLLGEGVGACMVAGVLRRGVPVRPASASATTAAAMVRHHVVVGPALPHAPHA